jgi:hypothetical protein
VFEDFAGEFLDRLALSPGGLPQSQKRIFVHFDLEMASVDVHVYLDGLDEFFIVRDAVCVPELRGLSRIASTSRGRR